MLKRKSLKSQKMETKAFYQKQMAEAKARQEAAQKRIDEAKNNQ